MHNSIPVKITIVDITDNILAFLNDHIETDCRIKEVRAGKGAMYKMAIGPDGSAGFVLAPVYQVGMDEPYGMFVNSFEALQAWIVFLLETDLTS